MNKKISAFLLAIVLLAAVPLAQAQQPKVYRIGVILPGGVWYETIEGLRVGQGSWGLKRGNNLLWHSEIRRAM